MRRSIPAALLALLIILTACDPKNAGLTPDSITISVTGLPTDLQPNITIAGPNNYQQAITATTRLEELPPGQYTISVQSVDFRGNPFDPGQTRYTLTLTAGGTQAAHVKYAPHRGYSQAAIEHLNTYREAAGVPPTILDEDGSLPNWLHARYMAENRLGGHEEDPNLPWYTPEGREAAKRSNVGLGGGDYRDDPTHVSDAFATAPFHFFSFLDPRTTTTRVGFYHRLGEGCCDLGGYGLAVEQIANGTWPAGQTVRFPADQQTINVVGHITERPSPLTACDYQAPAGLPIFVMHGSGNLPSLISTNLAVAGQPVEHCAFASAAYTNPDPAAQTLARKVLDAYGALVIVPREQLKPGTTYDVTVTYASGADQWQFHTSTDVTPYRLTGRTIK